VEEEIITGLEDVEAIIKDMGIEGDVVEQFYES
jgi:hypothetical protein